MMVKTTLNGKYDIILPKHRADRPEWHSDKGWEKARLDSLYDKIRKNDVIYYIGAEEGDMCALCQMLGGIVYMVEPNEKVLPNIKAIWDANKLPDTKIFKGFVGNENKWVDDDFIKVSDIEGEVIHDHGFKELHDNKDIPVIKLDSLCHVLPPPDIITMDVEGAEWEILQGGQECIKSFKPLIYLSLHPEFLFRIYEKYSYEVRRWIIELGYKETLLDYQHEVHLLYEPI